MRAVLETPGRDVFDADTGAVVGAVVAAVALVAGALSGEGPEAAGVVICAQIAAETAMERREAMVRAAERRAFVYMRTPLGVV
jgi:hypothetical protein